MNNQSYITFPIFDKFSEITCAFSTRIGGYSAGKYSSLNMGLNTGDNHETVLKNRRKFYQLLKINENVIAIPGQIHSSIVKYVDSAGSYPNVDALYTNKKNVFIAIQAADCFPIFVYDPNQKIVAIIHAGWRGALSNILRITLENLIKDISGKSEHLIVAIGPGLQSTCFEVKEDVFSKFSPRFLKLHKEKSKRYLDLNAFLLNQLVECGVKKENIISDNSCTHCDLKRFYSFRRDGNLSGRMMAIIGIRE